MGALALWGALADMVAPGSCMAVPQPAIVPATAQSNTWDTCLVLSIASPFCETRRMPGAKFESGCGCRSGQCLDRDSRG
ncbi:hypothetical protein D3C72_2320920 [compost metagenome]